MEKLAASEGRIISPKESQVRKTIGVVGLGITAATLALWPASRIMYPTVSFFVS